jgi:hypothetical protein
MKCKRTRRIWLRWMLIVIDKIMKIGENKCIRLNLLRETNHIAYLNPVSGSSPIRSIKIP